MEILHIKVNGTSPLLQHNPESMRRLRSLGPKVIPSPEEEAEASRYLLPDGNFYIPAVAVRNSMIGGGRFHRVGRYTATQVISAAIMLRDEVFPLSRDGSPLPGGSYSIDTRRAVVQGQGIMRSRAKIELPWDLEAIFEYDERIVSLADVRTVAELAGARVGLLDYRPEKKGWFGKFEVTEIWSD